MVNWKSKYLEMKMKYINAKQKGGILNASIVARMQQTIDNEVNNPDPAFQMRTYVRDFQNGITTLDQSLSSIMSHYNTQAINLEGITRRFITNGIPIHPVVNGRIFVYNDVVNRIKTFNNSSRTAADYNNLTQLIHTYVPEVGLMRYDREIMLRDGMRIAAIASRGDDDISELIQRYL